MKLPFEQTNGSVVSDPIENLKLYRTPTGHCALCSHEQGIAVFHVSRVEGGRKMDENKTKMTSFTDA